MTFDDALSYLLSLGHETLTIKLGLANTETLLGALGNPQQDFFSVQIAGTNGKGSTAVTLASICNAAGIRAGLFTSPHLVSITERIQIDGAPISESDFALFTEQVISTAAELVQRSQLQTLPTFFEHITAIALLAFRSATVDLAILETGLGGRLDSTTAAGARIVAITQIALDHQEYLGESLSEIAFEKAAIVRPDVIAIIAGQSEEALQVILRQCESVGVEPRIVDAGRGDHGPCGPPTEDGRYCVSLNGSESVRLGLRGRHQIANAAVAIALAEALSESGFQISPESMVKGVESTKHAGRLELWEGQPRILFDGAHNPAAARALRAYLDKFVQQPITMIFGAMRDKALQEMTAALFPAAKKIILTELDNPRAASLETLLEAVPEDFDRARILRASSPQEALGMANEITPADGLVCVTGSLYLIGAVQEVLKKSYRFRAREAGESIKPGVQRSGTPG